jgi:hypothetical protein
MTPQQIEALKLALDALHKCRDGFEYTRQYVGYETLPAIEGWSWYDGDVAAKEAITALTEALAQPEPWEKFCDSNCVWTDHHPDCKLAQPEQEPVAWMVEGNGDSILVRHSKYFPGIFALDKFRPLVYGDTTPPQRTWVGLTNQERSECWDTIPERAMKKVEAKLKDKNQ